MSSPGVTSIPGLQYISKNGGVNGFYDPFSEIILVDNLIGSVSGPSQLAWRITNNFTNINTTDASHPCPLQLQASNGGATETTEMGLVGEGGTSSWTFLSGNGSLDIYWIAQVPTLSTSGDRFLVTIGAGYSPDDNWTMQFNYSDNQNSGKWLCITQNAGSGTNTDSGVVVDTNWHKFHININAAGTTVTYFIDNVQVASVSTNVPTKFVPACNIRKSIGTNLRALNLNLFYLYYKMTTPR